MQGTDNAPATPVTRPGDLWLLGPHRLACGDATDPAIVALALGGAVPHLMVTDPPYGISYGPSWRDAVFGPSSGKGRATGIVQNDDRADWREVWTLFPGDVAYVWHSALHGDQVRVSPEASRFLIRSQIIWGKGRLIISRGHYQWRHETAWYAVRRGRTGHWAGDRKQTTV